MNKYSRTSLKDPTICRIFFSSPFNGMEGERETLTRKYWPQISSLCLSKGVEFVPVDMRWGITSELSDNAQTINICLREIDRSDMFIGFFGQVCVNVGCFVSLVLMFYLIDIKSN